MAATPSSLPGPARALAAAVQQAAARSSAATEAASAASVRALPLVAPRRRSAGRVDAPIAAAECTPSWSTASPPANAAAASSSSCRCCGRALCACPCARCGRSLCRCGPSYGAAAAAVPCAFSQRSLQQQQRLMMRTTTTRRGVATSAAEKESKQEQDNKQEQQQEEESKQEQQQDSQQQQGQQQPQHLFSRLRERLFGGGSGGGNASSASTENDESPAARAQRLLRAAAREVADAVLPREERVSLTRAYDGPVWQPGSAAAAAGNGTDPSSTALAVAPPPPPSAAKKLIDDLRARFGSHPLFARLAAAAAQAPGTSSAAAAAQAAARKAQDAVDALRDKYETSDHPAVHRAEEVRERLFGATEAAEALAEALRRDPRFDVASLLASVKHDARTVVGAFLAHDLPTLKQYAGPELLERLTGVFAHFDAQGGLREDPTILFVGDPELVEVRTVEGDPMVVVQFACQQIKATRDKFGNVVDGSPNSIQRVFYFWGLVQDKQGVVLPDGRPLPPRWVLKDMMWQSVLALV